MDLSGLGIETHDSAQYRYVRGQLRRSKKPQQLRGLNQNHNLEMKEIFKSTATKASCICLAFFPLEPPVTSEIAMLQP